MSTKVKNPKVVIILFSAITLILVLLLFGVGLKTKITLQKNNEFVSNIQALDAKIAVLGKKLNETASEMDRQSSELEEVRNKLTQERLKNSQLKQKTEELLAEFSTETEEPAS